jgi:hypothetical protein
VRAGQLRYVSAPCNGGQEIEGPECGFLRFPLISGDQTSEIHALQKSMPNCWHPIVACPALSCFALGFPAHAVSREHKSRMYIISRQWHWAGRCPNTRMWEDGKTVQHVSVARLPHPR